VRNLASGPICFDIKDYKTYSEERADSVSGKTNDHQNILLLYLSLRFSFSHYGWPGREDVEFRTLDGLTIRGWLYPATKRGAAIIATPGVGPSSLVSP
jgi:hypothetical protein